MRNYFVLMVLIMFSAQARAEWEFVSTDEMTTDNEATFYIDKGTIRNQAGYTAMWVLNDYKVALNPDGLKFGSVKVLYYFDCKNVTYGAKSYEFYDEKMGSGNVVNRLSGEPDQVYFTDAIPNSMFDKILRIACGKK